MKQGKLMWAFAVLVTIVYVATLLLVRGTSTAKIQHERYEQWRQQYVMYERADHAFVNTSNTSAKPIALSEGQGYGMYLTVAAGAKDWAQEQDFDDLLNYYLDHRTYVGEEHDTATYLMQWRQYSQGTQWVSQNDSATDGDLFIAYSLHQASKVWPKRSSYYLKIAHRLTDDILTYEYNSSTHTLTVGNWADEQSTFYNLMRTSDVMPTFFETFYQSSHDKRWLAVSNAMLDRMVDLSSSHATGLIPDFAWVSADEAHAVDGKTVATQQDGDYSSNACRVPMMLSMSKDSRAVQVLGKLLKFFNNQETITAGYSLSGKPVNDYQSNSFTAPLAYAAKQYQNKQYDRLLKDRQKLFTQALENNNYYDATLTTMAVMGETD
jgi:endo-1,4-beta-D-glucanase Y